MTQDCTVNELELVRSEIEETKASPSVDPCSVGRPKTATVSQLELVRRPAKKREKARERESGSVSQKPVAI